MRLAELFQSWRRAFRRGGNLWLILSLLLCTLILIPLATVILSIGVAGPKWEHIVSTVLAQYIVNTILLVGIVLFFSMLMAIPSAWLVSAFDFPGRRILEWALVLPLAIPTYVAAFVYIQIPELSIPFLVYVRHTWGIEAFAMTEVILRYTVLALFMASVLFPYLFITMRASFCRQNRSFIEAALMLGRSPTNVFFTVALPMARPAIVAGLSLILMEVMNDYGAVNFFGVPTLTEGIFRTWFGLEDSASGIRLAGFMMLAILFILFIEHLQRGKARYTSRNVTGMPLARRKLKGLSLTGAYVVCLIPLSMGLLFPVGQLILWAIGAARQSLPVFRDWQALNSLLMSFGSAILLTGVAVILAYAVRLHPFKWLRGMTRLATLGYAVPGVAVALGVMTFTGMLDRNINLPVLLSGSLFAIVFAYLVRFIAVPMQSVQAGMTRVCGSLDEASRMLGHGPGFTLWNINIPLLRGTLVASCMLVFIDILKELPLTMLLRPAGFDTLAVSAFGMAKEGRIYECAFPSLMIVLIGTIGLCVLNRLIERDLTQ
ncbi:MAG: iron ABC transporter permease [Verrucomicrobiota bacterium]